MSSSPAIKQDVTELVEAVERAKALFDAGDVERALKLSSVTYDQAKAAAATAERVKALRELVEKARRMQADALKIESMCYVALADEVDAAQARGEIASPGRIGIQAANTLRLVDVGIDRRRLSEARKLRDLVKANPLFIEQAIAERLACGLEPSRAAIRTNRANRRRSSSPKDVIEPRLCTGEEISTVRWYELPSMIGRLKQELQILQTIYGHCVPADPTLTTEQILGRDQLLKMAGGRRW